MLALAFAVALSGCAHGAVKVRGPVLLPARVPVRAFPTIWVAGGALEDETYLLDRLATHLAKDNRHEVRRVDLAELEPARKAGQIPTGTVVILLELELQEGVSRYWDTAPVQYCGYYGCSTQYQSYVASAPELGGEVALTVYEGPTARVLQRERFRESALGDDTEQMRHAVIEALAIDLERAVDVLKLRERVDLYRVKDVPGVDEAVERIRRGNWDEGRRLLERAAQSLGGQDKKTQAKVWFDLGLARWFAPGKDGLTQQAYEAAKRAFEWAVRLDPKAPHKAALVRLERARNDYAVLEEQRRATAYNFSILKPNTPAAPSTPDPLPAPPSAGEPLPAPSPAPDAAAPTSAAPASSAPATPPAK